MTNAIEGDVMVKPLKDTSNHKKTGTHEDQAKLLSALKELILQTPEINKSKVELIKEEIASGRYQISAKNIAAKMFIDVEIA